MSWLTLALSVAVLSIAALWQLRPEPVGKSLIVKTEQSADTSVDETSHLMVLPNTNKLKTEDQTELSLREQEATAEFNKKPTDDLLKELTPVEALEQQLLLLRREHGYDYKGAEAYDVFNRENEWLRTEILVENAHVYEQMNQWFINDPQSFIELSKTHQTDEYLRTVLEMNITPSNVTLLNEHLHIRNRHLIEIGYANELHQQNAQPYIELFDQFAGNHLIEYPEAIVAAVAEVDYWNKRDVLINNAVNTRQPEKYFNAIAAQNNEDMFALAEQMWTTHRADNYVTTLGGSSGKIERVRLAYQYGVDGSVTEIAELLANGIFVGQTIDEFTDVENASELFLQISEKLVYNKNTMRWVMP